MEQSQAARELKTDEDEGRWDERPKKVGKGEVRRGRRLVRLIDATSIALLFAAAACSNEPSDEQVDLISDVSGKSAEVAIEESEKIKDLEGRIEELEEKTEELENRQTR